MLVKLPLRYHLVRGCISVWRGCVSQRIEVSPSERVCQCCISGRGNIERVC